MAVPAFGTAPLCRRHHPLKTHTAWRYQRIDTGPDPGHYQWTSPTGHTYQARLTPKH